MPRALVQQVGQHFENKMHAHGSYSASLHWCVTPRAKLLGSTSHVGTTFANYAESNRLGQPAALHSTWLFPHAPNPPPTDHAAWCKIPRLVRPLISGGWLATSLRAPRHRTLRHVLATERKVSYTIVIRRVIRWPRCPGNPLFPQLPWLTGPSSSPPPPLLPRPARSRPHVTRGNWSAAEDRLLAQGHAVWGASWSRIARVLNTRTENQVGLYLGGAGCGGQEGRGHWKYGPWRDCSWGPYATETCIWSINNNQGRACWLVYLSLPVVTC